MLPTIPPVQDSATARVIFLARKRSPTTAAKLSSRSPKTASPSRSRTSSATVAAFVSASDAEPARAWTFTSISGKWAR